MKVGGIETWKELTIGIQQLVRLLFNYNFTNPGLVLSRPKFVAFNVHREEEHHNTVNAIVKILATGMSAINDTKQISAMP